MKLRMILSVFVFVGATALFVNRSVSDEKPADKPTAEESAKMLEEMAAMAESMKIAAPGEHHKHLEYFIGKWKTKTKMWMGGPGSEAMESDGTSEFKWVLGGRWVMEEHKGSFMGMPYEGIGLSGYDNYRNMYVGSWYSNMGTNVLSMSGMRHPETGLFTSYGEMDEPAMKVVGRTVKYVTKIIDKNSYVFSIIDLHAGDDYKVIEITYTRQ